MVLTALKINAITMLNKLCNVYVEAMSSVKSSPSENSQHVLWSSRVFIKSHFVNAVSTTNKFLLTSIEFGWRQKSHPGQIKLHGLIPQQVSENIWFYVSWVFFVPVCLITNWNKG